MWFAENRDTLGNIIIATPPCLAGGSYETRKYCAILVLPDSAKTHRVLR